MSNAHNITFEAKSQKPYRSAVLNLHETEMELHDEIS
jgi:hypothetical protein